MKKFIEKILGFEIVEVKELEEDLSPIETVYEDDEISIELLEDKGTYYVTCVKNGYEFVAYYISK